jgi:hypothetical protein
MTIFVDILRNYPKNNFNTSIKRYGTNWCHMWCDGDEEELHLMASKIGLKKRYFQINKLINHYDLVPSVRKKAIGLGAVEMSMKIWLREKLNGGIQRK